MKIKNKFHGKIDVSNGIFEANRDFYDTFINT